MQPTYFNIIFISTRRWPVQARVSIIELKKFATTLILWEKEGDLTQSVWQNPLYQQKIRKPKDNTQTPPKTSNSQRLRTDLGRSVGVTSYPTGVVKPVYEYPTFPLTTKAV